MKSVFKFVLGLLGALIALLLIAAIALPLMFDSDDLKAKISEQFNEQTGRDLYIDGDLSFSVFPWLAVEVEDLAVSNAEGFSESIFARVGEARIGVALVPLLQGALKIDTLSLDRVNLLLEVDSQGRGNWEDLAQPDEAGADEESEDSLISGGEIAGLQLSDMMLRYTDHQAGSDYQLSAMNLETGALGRGEPVPMSFTAQLEDRIASTSIPIEFTAVLTTEAANERIVLSDLEISLAELNASGRISASNISTALTFTGSLDVDSFSPRGADDLTRCAGDGNGRSRGAEKGAGADGICRYSQQPDDQRAAVGAG